MEELADNMLRMQVSLDRDLYERAKSVAKRQGISLAELCRRGLRETVSSEPDDSKTVDEVVYRRSEP